MLKCKTILILLVSLIIVFSLLGAWYSFSRTQKIAHNTSCEHSTTLCAYEIIPPSLWEIITGKTCSGLLCDNISSNLTGCDQSATTTPCSQITNIKKVPPTPVQQTQEPAASFVFGPLSRTYTDEKSGFSFQYPDEISLIDRHEGCIFFVDSPQPKSFLFAVQTPECSPDSKMASFEDYRKDYVVTGVEDTKLSFHHLSTENIKTKSGIEGISQKFSIENSEGQISRRYVFMLPQGGFVIFLKQFDNPESAYYLSLEQAITESLTFP